MELLNKDYVVELLNRKQLELDGWGATEAAMELGKARIEVADVKPDITIPDNPTNGDVIKATGLFEIVGNLSNDMLVCVSSKGFVSNSFISFSSEWWNEPYNPVRIDQTCGNCKHFSGEHACCRKGRFVNWNHRDIRIECPDWKKVE